MARHGRSFLSGGVGVRPPAGGAVTTLSATASDSVSVSDSATRAAQGFSRTASDSISVSDTATRGLSTARTASDSVSVSDAATRTSAAPRTASDSVTISDSATRSALARVRTGSDSVSVSDAATRISSRARTTSDSLSVSDSAAGLQGRTRTASDTVSVSDVATRAEVESRSSTDSFSVSDAATRALALTRAGADSVSVSDSATPATTLTRSASDSISVSDSASGTTSTGEPPVVWLPRICRIRERPPLRHHIEAISPSGRRYRWGQDERDPANVFSGLRNSSTMPGGHESLDCVLPRKPGIDYADLKRLSTIRVIGAGGQVRGEFRLERAPRVSGDKMSVSPSAVGWSAHLEDDKSVRAIYRDIEFGQWNSPSVQRRLNLLEASPTFAVGDPQAESDASTGAPSLKTAVQGPWANRAACVALYDAGGARIAALYYAWKRTATINPADTNWSQRVRGADNDTMVTGVEQTAELLATGPGAGTLTFTDPKRFLEVALSYAATGGTDGTEYPIYWTTLAAYGDHGLTLQGAEPQAGLLASDIQAHAVGRFAPLLRITDESISPTAFPIEHLAFRDPTTAGEIVRQSSRFELPDWAVWDDRVFWSYPRGSQGKRWRARISPAQLEETGFQVDRLWESVIVQYQDVDGSTRTVGPPGSGADTEDALLKDTDPDNPANELGLTRRDLLVMGTGTPGLATQIGARFLAESKLLDTSGKAQLVGHVEDDRGILHPYSAVRGGDQIQFVDAHDHNYRRVVKADHDHPTRACSVDLDSPPEGLAALLEQLGVALIPLGVG